MPSRTMAGILAGIIAGAGFVALCSLTAGFIWPVFIPSVVLALVVGTLVEGWEHV